MHSVNKFLLCHEKRVDIGKNVVRPAVLKNHMKEKKLNPNIKDVHVHEIVRSLAVIEESVRLHDQSTNAEAIPVVLRRSVMKQSPGDDLRLDPKRNARNDLCLETIPAQDQVHGVDLSIAKVVKNIRDHSHQAVEALMNQVISDEIVI